MKMNRLFHIVPIGQRVELETLGSDGLPANPIVVEEPQKRQPNQAINPKQLRDLQLDQSRKQHRDHQFGHSRGHNQDRGQRAQKASSVLERKGQKYQEFENE